MAKRAVKIVLLALGIFVVLFVLFNFEYFWKNTLFYFSPHKVNNQAAQSPPLSVAPKGSPNMLFIESLNISAPIVYATETTEAIFQADLINGVVHYLGTSNPGEFGNCYIFGHSSDYIWSRGKYKTVFALLPHISLGAQINISDQAGNQFVYIVAASHKVAANDNSVLSQMGYTKKLLTLQTSYPVGTALARWVVVAEIIAP